MLCCLIMQHFCAGMPQERGNSPTDGAAVRQQGLFPRQRLHGRRKLQQRHCYLRVRSRLYGLHMCHLARALQQLRAPQHQCHAGNLLLQHRSCG